MTQAIALHVQKVQHSPIFFKNNLESTLIIGKAAYFSHNSSY